MVTAKHTTKPFICDFYIGKIQTSQLVKSM
jgi:hypothetical protein